jgi:hypothetical protein
LLLTYPVTHLSTLALPRDGGPHGFSICSRIFGHCNMDSTARCTSARGAHQGLRCEETCGPLLFHRSPAHRLLVPPSLLTSCRRLHSTNPIARRPFGERHHEPPPRRPSQDLKALGWAWGGLSGDCPPCIEGASLRDQPRGRRPACHLYLGARSVKRLFSLFGSSKVTKQSPNIAEK